MLCSLAARDRNVPLMLKSRGLSNGGGEGGGGGGGGGGGAGRGGEEEEEAKKERHFRSWMNWGEGIQEIVKGDIDNTSLLRGV